MSILATARAEAKADASAIALERVTRHDRFDEERFVAEARAAEPGDRGPRCRYPARVLALAAMGRLGTTPAGECPAYEAWLAKLKASSVALVYAAQFGGNPASYMGHLFLKVRSAHRGPARNHVIDAMDQTFGFVALVPEGTGGFAYAMKGLFGGFDGGFIANDFRELSYEYHALESRDLWEYEVALTGPQLALFLAHLWELLQHPPFTYRFFTGNCAAMLGEMVWAVRPEVTRPPGTYFFTTPHEVVQWLEANRLVSSVRVYPSERATFLSRLRLLPEAERDQVEKDFEALTVSEGKGYRHYDALVARLDYEEVRRRNEPPPAFTAARERALSLLAKAPLPEIAQPEAKAETTDPRQAHPMTLLLLGLGSRAGKGLVDFEVRPAGHDLLDPAPGFSDDMGLAFVAGRVRYDGEARRLRLSYLDLMRMKNLSPFTLLDAQPAWAFRFGAYDPGLKRFARGYLGAAGSVGFGTAFGKLKTWALAGGAARYALVERRGDLGPSLEAGVMAHLVQELRFIATTEVLLPFEIKAKEGPMEQVHTLAMAAALEKNMDLRLEFTSARSEPVEAMLALARFF